MWAHSTYENRPRKATQAADVYRSMQHPVAYRYAADRPKSLENMLHPAIVSAHVVYYKLRRYYGRTIDWPTFEIYLARLFDLGWLYPMRTCSYAPISLIYVNVFALAHLLETTPEMVELPAASDPSDPAALPPRRPSGSLLSNILAAAVGALPGFTRVAVLNPTTFVILAVQGVSYTAGTCVARLDASDDYTAFGCATLGLPRYAHDNTWQWLHAPAVPLVTVCPDVPLVRRLVGLFGGYTAIRTPIDPCILYAPGFLADPRLSLAPPERWAEAPEQNRAWLFWAADLERALASLDGAPVVPRHLKLSSRNNDPDGTRFVHPCNFLLDLQFTQYPYADDTIERDVVLDTTPPSVGFELPDDPSPRPLHHYGLDHVPLCRTFARTSADEPNAHAAQFDGWPTWYDVPFEPPFTNALFEFLANPWTSGRVGPWPSRLIGFGDRVYPFTGFALQEVELVDAPAFDPPGSVPLLASSQPSSSAPPSEPEGEFRSRADSIVLRVSGASDVVAVEPAAASCALATLPASVGTADAYLSDPIGPVPRRTLDTPFGEPLALRAVLSDVFLSVYGQDAEPVTPGVRAAASRCWVPPADAPGSAAPARLLRRVAPARCVTTLAPTLSTP